jgi:hypothetical protein
MSRSKRRRSGSGRPTQHYGSVVTEGDARVIRTGEVIDLGDLTGEERAPVIASFTFGEQRFRVNPNLTELDVVDLLEQAQNVKMNDPSSMTMTKDYARAHIHPDDFDEFWKAARARGYDTERLMTLCWKLLDGITGNPTGGQSGSSDGQPATKTSSPPTSSALVTDLGAERARRAEAYLAHLERLGNQRGEDGQPIPLNAAIQLQLVEQAKTQGIDLEAVSRSVAATG